MTDFTPPRRVEVLLESLGASIEYRDALVGDLAEEFASRAERDGSGKARRWYYREAVRVTPHLVRNAARAFSRADLRHTANVIGLAYVCTITLAMFVTLTVFSVARAAGVSSGAVGRFWTQPIPTMAVLGFLVLVMGEAMAGGFFAAWLDRRAPVVSACALGLVWSCALSIAPAFVGVSSVARFPIWYSFTVPVIVVLGATAGGVLRVCSRGGARGGVTAA
jgi:hypothetical protein